jgi:peptidyl-prolyl cis-trans isomerase C
VVKVEDRRPEQPISLEEARPQIVRFLTYDQIRTLLDRLRMGSKVEMLLSRPADATGQAREPASAPPPGSKPPATPAPVPATPAVAPEGATTPAAKPAGLKPATK